MSKETKFGSGCFHGILVLGLSAVLLGLAVTAEEISRLQAETLIGAYCAGAAVGLRVFGFGVGVAAFVLAVSGAYDAHDRGPVAP